MTNKLFNYKWYLLVSVIFFFIGLCVGWKTCDYFKEPKIVTKVETKYVEVEGKTKTEIQYVEKKNKSDSDVEVINKNPTVSVNGKQYTFDKLPTESNKFEKGKVTVEQGYTIKIDSNAFKMPKWGMDVGYSNHGYYVGGHYNFNKNLSVGIFGTP